MSEYTTRKMGVIVAPKGDSIYADKATRIGIEDEGGGEYAVIEQTREDGKVCIDPDEWPHIRDAINDIMEEIRKHEKKDDAK